MIHVIARMELNEGCKEAMLKVLSGVVPKVLSEDGCIMYTPCLDADEDPNGTFLTIVEAWKDRDALDAHLATAHMAEFREAVKDLRKNSSVKVLTPAL